MKTPLTSIFEESFTNSSINEVLELLFTDRSFNAINKTITDKTKNIDLYAELCNVGVNTFISVPDEVLQSFDENTKKKSLEYLKCLKARYDDLIEIAMTRVSKIQPKEKSLEEMSKEELISYIKERFNK